MVEKGSDLWWFRRWVRGLGGCERVALLVGCSKHLVEAGFKGRSDSAREDGWLFNLVEAMGSRGWRPSLVRRVRVGEPSVWQELEASGFSARRVNAGVTQEQASFMSGVTLGRWRSWEQARRRVPAYGWVLLQFVEWRNGEERRLRRKIAELEVKLEGLVL